MAEQILFPFHAPSERVSLPVRAVTLRDLGDALRQGVADLDTRAPRMFVYLIYPVIGLVLVWMAMDRALLPLVFPLVAGFALLGPFLAIGLYEISRAREQGRGVTLAQAFNVLGHPAKGALLF